MLTLIHEYSSSHFQNLWKAIIWPNDIFLLSIFFRSNSPVFIRETMLNIAFYHFREVQEKFTPRTSLVLSPDWFIESI